MVHQTYAVQGMTCEHCVRAVTAAVAELPGTEKVTVDLAAGSVAFESPAPIDRGGRGGRSRGGRRGFRAGSSPAPSVSDHDPRAD